MSPAQFGVFFGRVAGTAQPISLVQTPPVTRAPEASLQDSITRFISLGLQHQAMLATAITPKTSLHATARKFHEAAAYGLAPEHIPPSVAAAYLRLQEVGESDDEAAGRSYFDEVAKAVIHGAREAAGLTPTVMEITAEIRKFEGVLRDVEEHLRRERLEGAVASNVEIQQAQLKSGRQTLLRYVSLLKDNEDERYITAVSRMAMQIVNICVASLISIKEESDKLEAIAEVVRALVKANMFNSIEKIVAQITSVRHEASHQMVLGLIVLVGEGVARGLVHAYFKIIISNEDETQRYQRLSDLVVALLESNMISTAEEIIQKTNKDEQRTRQEGPALDALVQILAAVFENGQIQKATQGILGGLITEHLYAALGAGDPLSQVRAAAKFCEGKIGTYDPRELSYIAVNVLDRAAFYSGIVMPHASQEIAALQRIRESYEGHLGFLGSSPRPILRGSSLRGRP